MGEYVILTDSTCDLTKAQGKQMGVEIVPLNLSIDKAEYKAYDGTKNQKEFYNALRQGNTAFTSSPNIQMFMDKMLTILKSGKDILYIGLGSALSSTFQNACLAADALKNHYQDKEIICIDSKSVSLGIALMLAKAAKAKESGKTIFELKEYLENLIPNVSHWFTVEDLSYLKNGGRISATMTKTGSALHIYPILKVTQDGKLESIDKVKGRKATIKALANKVAQNAKNIESEQIFICHGDCEKEASELAAAIKEKIGAKDYTINCCEPIIGAHVGPGAIGVFFVSEKR